MGILLLTLTLALWITWSSYQVNEPVIPFGQVCDDNNKLSTLKLTSLNLLQLRFPFNYSDV